ncbi:MAG: putative porin [Desulfarculus sp.]|nr:putative porin [Pseudomonadota bacterium]MBV1716263.1 putative porin [Desulfarculus sp.]MBU4574500.1 putative porin [Pseudomonadota bacterium]MBU4599391.1 putative porin [Pseudomonadota bacterium]MBV1737313.1 putative porin [Desulfarculus sp.]
MAIGFWSAAPANAATQAELEAKIKMMEQALNEMKGQLNQVQTTQVQQQAVQLAAESKLPSWVERMTFYGDTRFRYEHTSYDDLNGKAKSGKDRFRVRLRFGVRSQIHEDVELGFRMVTGADDDATSTNQTMGNYFGEYSKWGLDRAYVKWTPSFVPGKGLAFSFGKVPQPFMTSKVIWDGDVVPEGGFLQYTFNKGGAWQPYVLAAYMTVEQAGEFSDNVLAPAAQIGVKGKVGAFSLKASTGYTSWGDMGDVGKVPDSTNGNPTWEEGGGERMSNFGVWDVYAKGSFKFDKKGSVFAWGHYLTNQSADGPYSNKDTGWGAGAGVKYDKFGFDVWYKYVEANATPGFIADSDSGYVNRKGFVVSASYQMWKYGKVVLSYYNTDPIDSDIDGASNGSQTFFTDFVFKF